MPENQTQTGDLAAVRSNRLLCVSVGDGKYTVIQEATGHVHALRYDEPWRDCCGDGLILAMAHEIQELRDRLTHNDRTERPEADHEH